MLLKDLKQLNEETSAISQLDAAKKALEHLIVRHARVEEFYVESDTISVDVEYEFPEHLPTWGSMKKDVFPTIKKVSFQKSERWKEGLFGATIWIQFDKELDTKTMSAIKKLLSSEKKRTNPSW